MSQMWALFLMPYSYFHPTLHLPSLGLSVVLGITFMFFLSFCLSQGHCLMFSLRLFTVNNDTCLPNTMYVISNYAFHTISLSSLIINIR